MKGITILKTRLLILVTTFVSTFLVLLLIVGLLRSKAASADGPTYVSGGIFADTTWSASQSPYIVTGTVAVFPTYALTVEPGVEVRFNSGTSLIIRGTLVADGTASNHIVFTSNATVPSEGSWGGIEVARSLGGSADSVKFAEFSFAESALSFGVCDGICNISDSLFSNNIYAFSGGELQVERCTFENNTEIAVSGSQLKILNSVFRNNRFGLYNADHTQVNTSIFINNGTAIWLGSGEVVESMIISNGRGVHFSEFRLFHNNIAYNVVGVNIMSGQGPEIEYNNIYNNTEYNLRNSSPENIDESNNWWGTKDTSVIDEGIYDGRDDVLVGLVNYQPFLQERQGGEWSTQYLPSVTKHP